MYRLMLVDDEQAMLNALRRLVHPFDFNIRTYTDPSLALNDLKSFNPHMVISDYKMRPLDGVSFLTMVSRVIPDSVRILITAHADVDVVVKAVNSAGVCRIVTKPWDNKEFIATIRVSRSKQQLRLNDRKDARQRLPDQEEALDESEALWQLEEQHPGITRVDRDDQGNILLVLDDGLDEEMLKTDP